MGLNEIFNNARGNILMMEPLPNVSKAYSLIIQDEKQRSFQNLPVFQSDSASFSFGSNSKPKYSFNNPRNNFNNQSQKYNFPTQNQYRKGNSDGKGISDPQKLFCRYCKKKNGHLIEKCYKLHGYPQNFKFGNKNARIVANVYSNPESKVDNFSENLTSSTTITADQYKQLINILQQVQSHLNPGSWIIDSGATDHMTYDKNLLTNITDSPIPILVTLPNGYKVKVTSIGPSLKKPLVLGKMAEGIYLLNSSSTGLQSDCSTVSSSLSVHVNNANVNKSHILWHNRLVVPKSLRDKFSPRSTPCIFLGYPPGKKAYKLLQLLDRKILISRDVVFHENIFPYSESTSPITLFPDVFYSSNFDHPTSCIPGPTNSSHQHNSPPSQNISTPSPSSVNSLSPPVSIPLSNISAPSQVTASEVPPRYPSRHHHQPSYSERLYIVLEPTTYQQAALHPAWQEAMLKEFEALEANATWDIVPPPPEKKPIGNK
uniref:Uncharacterized protein n=1 Tax=Nicotiana tabacum TaxID=4097 RepID=A0A1S3X6K3_TOBAC